jgi:hypothetical protein
LTDIDVYQPAAQPDQYQARMTMTPDDAKALDQQVRLCTRAVLRDGVDYGTIPGAGDRKLLLKPGAEKLLQWFGFGFTCDRVDLELDDDGQKQGVTYRCTITKQLPEGRIAAVTTCEGYAGYDELKFFKPVTDAERHKAEARERGWAAKDRRPADPTKWQNLMPYKAPWNTILKMAQKRAIVGAAIVATAASGLFATEEDESPVADDGSTWYEQALETAGDFTDPADEGRLYVEAAKAHRAGWCNRKQADEIQYAIRQRGRQLKTVTVTDAEDLGRQAAASPEGTKEEADPAEQPQQDRHRKLVGGVRAQFKRLGYTDADDTQRLEHTARLAGTSELGSTNDLDEDELSTVLDALARCRNIDALKALLEAGETGG